MKALALALFLLQAPPSSDPAAELAPGIELFDTQRLEEARAFFEPYAASHPKSAAVAFYLGRIFLEEKETEKAVDWLERAAGLDPGNSDLHRWLARAYGVAAQSANPVAQTRYAREAKAALDKAVRLDPKNLRAREDLIQFHLNSPEFLGGSVEQARQHAEEMRKLDPVAGRMMLASIALRLKDPAQAAREYQAAIHEAPKDLRPRTGLGYLYQSQSRWAEAFDAFEGALQVDPGSWDILYQIGRTGALSGQRLDRAQEALAKYLGHTPTGDDPPLAGAHFRLGMVYEKKGDPARAREHYRKSLELDPANAEVRKALERLPGI
ncbi:MAG: tetratricopeptide repeat protein [Thermoanaerobaculia bacterium]